MKSRYRFAKKVGNAANYTIVVSANGKFAVVTNQDQSQSRRIVPIESLDLPEPADEGVVFA